MNDQTDDPPRPPSLAVLDQAREIIGGFLAYAQDEIPKIQRSSWHRDSAGRAAEDAQNYATTAHIGFFAARTVFACAHVDAACGSSLVAALQARWAEVRNALPESVRDSIPERSWGVSITKAGKVRPRGVA